MVSIRKKPNFFNLQFEVQEIVWYIPDVQEIFLGNFALYCRFPVAVNVYTCVDFLAV